MPPFLPVSFKFAVPALALGALLLVGGCDRQSGREAQGSAGDAAPAQAVPGRIDRSHAGQPMPALTFRDPAGKTLKLPSLKGKPVLVNLWATWCAPCVAELPTLDALAARKGDALRVLTVSEDLGEPAEVSRFLAGKGITRLEPWLDPENEATVRYGVSTLPVTILYDADGREVWRLAGGHDWGSPGTDAMLSAR